MGRGVKRRETVAGEIVHLTAAPRIDVPLRPTRRFPYDDLDESSASFVIRDGPRPRRSRDVV